MQSNGLNISLHAQLLPKVFAWALGMHPMQPLTSRVWVGDSTHPESESATTKIQLTGSDSWQRPYVLIQPTIWFHAAFRQDDTPNRQGEVDLLCELTGRGTPQAPPLSAP